ncbi:nicotinate phosphoribosyltransferase, putative [Perkinsus marinus ATCC 50983]|uniref:Nicotinate phosphoribosyltransferase n=1 Tax=Perkinsus marinus (strain ATCC 50983 / TXsc) TaxID=423536 RepID=C5KGH3_PERM5|nr:nicotinate phosphoribosyltransferase, putative [Perkinsus marinus ATCC 50983]EER16529.1 nicotinate phosphoribosyltransferase, putative [Perkinsus marinus ATCC 50983]|eukprot:XP_002784733.1 nicotinate phosphoribosyltransferase, putative [Perkinsus marinus ATCC 50983]
MGTPHSDVIESTLTDLYQITMAYAYWQAAKTEDHAVFDVYFRKCPFNGEFVVCAGIDEVVRFANTFCFTPMNIEYLKTQLPTASDEFFQYLLTLDAKDVTIHAVREGDFVFPREPVLRVAGPLIVCQLLETGILTLLNFPCLIATQAARLRIAAGDSARLMEFGCRRAQGPDGALSASRYAYIGGFDATSNVKAGHAFDIPLGGTHAHAFVTSFHGLEDLDHPCRPPDTSNYNPDPRYKSWLSLLDDPLSARVRTKEFEQACVRARIDLCIALDLRVLAYVAHIPPHIDQVEMCNDGELVAFIRYAQAFPSAFLALVDTFETLSSGIPNFISVALGLWRIASSKAIGIRLDSGDLAYLSIKTRELFLRAGDAFESEGFSFIKTTTIVVSNDINEDVMISLKEQKHCIDSFGIGTNLVTCQAQPALGMVYKLVELNDQPKMKLSQDIAKQGIPSRKALFRLYGMDGIPILDLMQGVDEPEPKPHERVFCRHLFDEQKRCYVRPERVKNMLVCIWDHGTDRLLSPAQFRCCREQFDKVRRSFRQDHLRPVNPTPYKVSTSGEFFDFYRQFWQETVPVREFS